ncbi:hypothetical protein [Sphingomonas bacterium]|uniref:hypothetical protein n=1 Tax=Sphingomonas bacterium TaxID=1895847 RepID=UPI001576F4E2|nr:hypothetical protein [Sphingomonas bacterium]
MASALDHGAATTIRHSVAVLALLVLASCAQPTSAPDASSYDVNTPFKEFMGHVVQPAAARFWAGSGTVYDATGLHDRTPTTPEGWEAVEGGGLELVEIGNVLKLPARVRSPQADWIGHADMIIALAREAAQAAEHHDKAAMLSVGSRLDAACEACHIEFMTPEQRGDVAPAKTAGH